MAVAVVSAPAAGRRWWAARGEGAFADDRPIRVSTLDRLEHAAVSTAHERHAPVLAERVWHSRGFGDFWQHMLVAEGSLEAAVDPVMNVWDNAALQLLVEEAGGRFTDVRGRPGIDGGSAVSSNGLLHDGVLRALEGAVEQDA